MKKFLKTIATILTVLAGSILLVVMLCNLKPVNFREKAAELKVYCLEHGYNTDYGLLVDFGRFSLQKRLYVYDFNKNEVVMKSLAGHGSGGNSTLLKPDFSNDHGSHCTSLGHYSIGKHRHMYNRPTVPAVEVHGLDKTNSNALTRGILIHPAVGPLSWGCVTLPVTRYAQLSNILEGLPQNVVVWAYK